VCCGRVTNDGRRRRGPRTAGEVDDLHEEARRVRTSRNELLAALIATAEIDREALENTVSQYRGLRIGDVLPGQATDSADNVVVPMRKPGRPAASSGGA
jgi:hypothetical protein